MKWKIPAKTFLLGEYAAVAGEAAILVTTTPCFELALIQEKELSGIHPQSPAGRYWTEQGVTEQGLVWHDPYQGRGGLGASSAQFIGCYLASCQLQNQPASAQDMLDKYYHYAWNREGLKPSGYDVIAQSQQGCVYIDRKQGELQTLPWPFKDIGFLLLHTGTKLATHQHLQKATLPPDIDALARLSQSAKTALQQADSEQFIDAINQYRQQLAGFNLIAEHSERLISELINDQRILALKGCGALGADVILILCRIDALDALAMDLRKKNLAILASQDKLFF